MKKGTGPGNRFFFRYYNLLGQLYLKQGKYTEAEEILKQSLELAESTCGPDHIEVAVALEPYAYFLYKLNRVELAKQIQDQAKAIREAQLP